MSSTARLFFVMVLFFYSTVSAQEFPYSRSEPCPVDELFPRAREIAAKIPVNHSTGSTTYRHTIIHSKSSTTRTPTDFVWRTIPLVLLNLSSCELTTTTITRRIENGNVATLLSTDDSKFISIINKRLRPQTRKRQVIVAFINARSDKK